MVSSHFWLVVFLLFKGVFSQEKGKENDDPEVVEKGDKLIFKCGKDCKLELNNQVVAEGVDLDLGSLWNDPRGLYTYYPNKDSKKNVHVYVRRCMNCIELDPGTIAGFVVADVIMICLIAMSVYFVSGSETRRPGRASDKQNLIERDSEYQMLGRRDNDQYSHLALRAKKGGF